MFGESNFVLWKSTNYRVDEILKSYWSLIYLVKFRFLVMKLNSTWNRFRNCNQEFLDRNILYVRSNMYM